MKIIGQILITAAIFAGTSKPAATEAAQAGTAPRHRVKDDSVTSNMPEGMTKDQADEILKELKAIHQLLERQQLTRAQPPETPASDKVQMTMAAGWHWLGRDDAPVTVVEFADYQCPFCRKFHTETFAALKKNYIDTGKVRFASRDLPLDFHPNAPGSAIAVRCAGEQNKFWEMRDAMLAGDADLSSAALLKYARQSDLDMDAFSACLNENRFSASIQKDIADAGALGIRGTPSFVVGKTAKDEITGVRIAGAVPYSAFETADRKSVV